MVKTQTVATDAVVPTMKIPDVIWEMIRVALVAKEKLGRW